MTTHRTDLARIAAVLAWLMLAAAVAQAADTAGDPKTTTPAAAAPAAAPSAGATTVAATPAAAPSAGATTVAATPAAAPSTGAKRVKRAVHHVTTTSSAVARTPATGPAPRAGEVQADTSMTLRGSQEGTVFHSLTIEGEDRIHVDVARPPLAFDVDPTTAPGLQGGSVRDVFDRSEPDNLPPLLAWSSRQVSPDEGRPWLSRFATGGVARFEPEVKGAVWWKLTVADARGRTVMWWEGNGNPPDQIVWDGRARDGTPVMPGLTYSHVLEARDRAGNRRHFVGQGFQVPAFRYDGPQGPLLVFAGRELDAPASADGAVASSGTTPEIVLEAASWLDQSERTGDPVRVTATARTAAQAQMLADRVARALAPRLFGDPSRVRTVANAEPGAPEDGAVAIELAKK